jgi:hypothetical protein
MLLGPFRPDPKGQVRPKNQLTLLSLERLRCRDFLNNLSVLHPVRAFIDFAPHRVQMLAMWILIANFHTPLSAAFYLLHTAVGNVDKFGNCSQWRSERLGLFSFINQ